MRWKSLGPSYSERFWDWVDRLGYRPTFGTRRIIRRFLFFPAKLENEVRWLETANIEQEFYEGNYGDITGGDSWKNIRWVNEWLKS